MSIETIAIVIIAIAALVYILDKLWIPIGIVLIGYAIYKLGAFVLPIFFGWMTGLGLFISEALLITKVTGEVTPTLSPVFTAGMGLAFLMAAIIVSLGIVCDKSMKRNGIKYLPLMLKVYFLVVNMRYLK